METNKITEEQIETACENVIDTIDIPNLPRVDLKTPDSDSEYITDMNEAFAMKRHLYEDVLAPQVKENEILKRGHKTQLMDNIFVILKWQFIATYIFVTIVLLIMFFSSTLKISGTLAIEAISFIKFYITSIIVELISILYFIVKNVFDTSITDLFSNFDKNNKDKADN